MADQGAGPISKPEGASSGGAREETLLALGSQDPSVLSPLPAPLPSPPPSSLPATSLTSAGMAGMLASVPIQDLTQDKLILSAPRVAVEGMSMPALGGIPLLAKLGQGGMGAVYYGIHPRLKLEVAVKVLPFHLAGSQPGLVERFFREAQIAANVQSPHLVNVKDVNEDHGLYYLVMEYVRGSSAGGYLKQLKAGGKTGLAEPDALEVCIAAAKGLEAAHTDGIIHRDIKPDNIMIPKAKGGEGLLFKAAKLADLGLARGEDSQQSLTGVNLALGSPGYMAPEQAQDAKTAGKPADIFSLGAALYALLSGRVPFSGDSLLQIFFATMHKPHEPLRGLRPDVSAPTCALVDRCLSKSPAERFPDASALLEALLHCRAALDEPAKIPSSAFEPTVLVAKPKPPAGAPAVAAPAPQVQAGVNLTSAAPPAAGSVAAPVRKGAGWKFAFSAVFLLGSFAAGGPLC